MRRSFGFYGQDFDNGDVTLLSTSQYVFGVHAPALIAANNGAGAVASAFFGPKGYGQIATTGTATNGKQSVDEGTAGTGERWLPYSKKTVLSMWEYIYTLATDGEDYRLYIGATSINAFSGLGERSIHFLYDRAVSANWQCVTRNASTSTTTDSGVAVAATTDYHLVIEMVSDTEIKLYIDGVLVATHTTNIPAASNNDQQVHVRALVKKIGGTASLKFEHAGFAVARKM